MDSDIISADFAFVEDEEVLKLASIFNKEFSLDWLVDLTGKKASTTLSILEDSAQKGLLTRIKPAIYIFNEQYREEWRNQLALDEKKRFHHHIAGILIQELPDKESKPLRVAAHLLKATIDLEGCQWLMRAGEIYADRHQAEEAIICFYHILTELSDQYGVEKDLVFIKAAIAHANSFAGRTDLAVYLQYLKDARKRAENRNWQDYTIVLEMRIAVYERLSMDFNSSIDRFDKAYQKARSIKDPHLKSIVDVSQTYFLFWQGRFQEAITFFEKSVPDIPRVPFGFFPLLASIMLGHCYTIIGQVSQGLGMLDDLRNYCLDKNDRFLLAHASSTIANAMLAINRIDDAVFYIKMSLKEADESQNEWVGSLATIMMAYALYLKGNNRGALTYLDRFTRHKSNVIRRNLLLFPYLLEICWAMESGKLKAIEGYSLTDEIEEMSRLNNYYMKGLAYRYKAMQLASQNATNEQVIRNFSTSQKWLQKSGFYVELAKTQLALARYYLAEGKNLRATSTLTNIADLMKGNGTNLIPDDLRPLIKTDNRDESILAEILSMSDHISTGKSKSKLLQHIITTVNRVTGAERGALLVFENRENATELRLRAAKNISKEHIADSFFLPSMRLIQESIQTGECLIYEANPSTEETGKERPSIRSSICAPLIIGKKTVGVLYHDNRILGNVFKEYDKKLLSYFASIAALDIDRENFRRAMTDLVKKAEKNDYYPEMGKTDISNVDGIVGESEAMKKIFIKVKDAGKSDIAVLITGETGVGKNMLAKAIHNHSQRKDGPFITVQCSALTEGLITSELFGHEKGAFTGATHRHIGRFELANGGTLFLDEIGDLSLEVQARLLRVLQSKEFERVGGGKDVLTSDFRLIAATNKSLEEEIQAKRFREDLYFRINVYPILVPPLRERKEDIPLLITHLRNKNGNPKESRAPLSQETLEKLMSYSWPGNIRELENVVQRSLINPSHTDLSLPGLYKKSPRPINQSGIASLEENERQHIIAALCYTKGKIHGPGGAAKLLSINASTLSSKLKKLGIKKSSYNNAF